MKKAGIFCICALCAIFVGFILGCSGGGGGGSEIEDNGVNNGDQQGGQQQGGNGGQEQGGQEQGGNQQGGTTNYRTGECQGETIYQGEFGGAQFIGGKEDWTYTYVDENQEFTKHYGNAQNFMNQKVNELRNELNNKDTTTPLYNTIAAALQKYTNTQNVADAINNNYLALAPVFADIDNEFIKSEKYLSDNRFNASYHKLAQNAYNQSMGAWRNSPSYITNREMDNSPENFFVYELDYAGLTYDELTVDKAKEVMNDALSEIAQQTNTETAVLKKVVELALYNESLYGLHDFAKENHVNMTNSLSERSLITFQSWIENAAYYIDNKQNIDDRTM